MSTQLTRPVRDLIIQVLATVMIPLTVAGTGLYYTRWQQNLSDLKTMIDMVSDENSEKRKYGVAMFEYLLKNDKVPVEFVAAQLNYANSSTDKELLPLMEAALMTASSQNTSVAETFREALDRLPSRLFVNVLDDKQRICFTTLVASIKDIDRGTLSIPGIVKAQWGGVAHELRILRDSDGNRGEAIAALFKGLGLDLKVVDLSKSWDGARQFRPNTFELWLGSAPLPQICGSSGTASLK
ncbi:hypothetical protein BH10PSE7_BH10PSE7_43290 [soil metagenome]